MRREERRREERKGEERRGEERRKRREEVEERRAEKRREVIRGEEREREERRDRKRRERGSERRKEEKREEKGREERRKEENREERSKEGKRKEERRKEEKRVENKREGKRCLQWLNRYDRISGQSPTRQAALRLPSSLQAEYTTTSSFQILSNSIFMRHSLRRYTARVGGGRVATCPVKSHPRFVSRKLWSCCVGYPLAYSTYSSSMLVSPFDI
jgi:hypothetical protein